MKQNVLKLGYLLMISTLALVISCNKNNNEANQSNVSNPKMMTHTDYSVTIDARGYLVFDTE